MQGCWGRQRAAARGSRLGGYNSVGGCGRCLGECGRIDGSNRRNGRWHGGRGRIGGGLVTRILGKHFLIGEKLAHYFNQSGEVRKILWLRILWGLVGCICPRSPLYRPGICNIVQEAIVVTVSRFQSGLARKGEAPATRRLLGSGRTLQGWKR
jgi:hypothetical protein